MKQDSARKTWASPKLEQLPMVNTTFKGSDMSESVNTNMFMTPTAMAS